PRDLTAWLTLMEFDYAPINEGWAILRLLGGLDAGVGRPVAPTLVAQHDVAETRHRGFGVTLTRCAGATDGRADSTSGLLWRVSFVVALDVVEYPRSL